MAAVTAGVTTGGVVSEVGVTAAETGDSEEVVTGMVDAEGECMILKTHFYQPRSGMVMQNCRSKRDFYFLAHCNLCFCVFM